MSSAVYLVEFPPEEHCFEALRDALVRETEQALKGLSSNVEEVGHLNELLKELLRAQFLDMLYGLGGDTLIRVRDVWYIRTSRYARGDLSDVRAEVIYGVLKNFPGMRFSLVTEIFDRKQA